MSFCYSQKSFYGSIHKVVTSATVNMYIDKSWGDILLVGIYDPVVSLRNICFGRYNMFYLTIPANHCFIGFNAGREY